MAAAKALDGITVIELGTSVAAPYAGMILADLGARVIKVENPKSGDYARDWGPPFWKESSSAFHSLNRGKQSIAVDFSTASDARALAALILGQADAVIQNLRPGVLEKFGLDCSTLRAQKPDLIWCDIGAFGGVGPLAGKPGYDPLVQASTGIMSVTGTGDGQPVRVGVSLVDMGSGMWTVIGLLSSLISRGRDGKGATVSTSLYETGLAWMTVPLAGYAANGEVRRPHGSGVAEIVPYQAFRTQDGWIMVAAGNDALFRRLCGVLGCGGLVDDPRYATNSARVVNRETLIGRLSAEIGTRMFDDFAAALDAAGVPNAPLLTVDRVFDHPQTHALDLLRACEGDELPLVGTPLAFDGERPRSTRPAPGLGQDNAETLGEASR